MLRLHSRTWPVLLAVAAVVAGCQKPADPPPAAAPTPSPADLEPQITRLCGTCHQLPKDFASTFPRSEWKREVEQAYTFAADANIPQVMPPMESVINWFEQRAPEKLPDALFEKSETPLPVRLQRTSCPGLSLDKGTAISNVNLVHLSDEKKLDVLACEMRTGRIFLYKPYED